VLADSAYGTGEALAALTAAGHTPVIKPWPLRPAVPGGLALDDFTVEEAAGAVRCPHGVTRPISRTRAVTFGAACRGCPLHHRRRRAQPAAASPGRAAARPPGPPADPDLQAICRRHRPMVERSLAWLTRGHRRVRYRGVLKNDAWLHLRTAAINLRRLLVILLRPASVAAIRY
jgi:hypothetical protein